MRSRWTIGVALAAAPLAGCSGCGKTSGEPAPIASDSAGHGIAPAAPQPSATSVAPTAAIPTASAAGDGGDPSVIVRAGGSDPLSGKWTLADATKDLRGSGALVATLTTAKGVLTCKLYEDKAPNTVANFVGLATGARPWKNWAGNWVKQPAYDGTTFHRIIKGFMIQGGDPNGAKTGQPGTGDPGYSIPDEIWPGATHNRAGLLCMANRGPNTNGYQFFITDGAPTHLDGGYTIFGECSPVEIVHQLAAWPVRGDQAIDAPVISKVTIGRK